MENKTLFGANAIMEYLGITRQRYYRLVRHGMPITKDAAGIRAHKDNLDEFFRKGEMTMNSEPKPNYPGTPSYNAWVGLERKLFSILSKFENGRAPSTITDIELQREKTGKLSGVSVEFAKK